MKRAWISIRTEPWYRRQAFEQGLRKAGYELQTGSPVGRPGDVLVQWNRYAVNHEAASQFERGGGTVLVAENGYLGRGGVSPKFDVHPGGPKPDSYYAIAKTWHNGRGWWPDGPARWPALGVELKPWRTEGGHILVCPNRSFGIGEQVMPADWAQRCVERLRKQTGREIRVRGHPGNDAPRRPLIEDLRGAWAVVIWSSSCGVHALVEGIPVFCEAPYWILKGAAFATWADLEAYDFAQPWENGGATGLRLEAFRRMAWAQWQTREIEAGEPFACLLPG